MKVLSSGDLSIIEYADAYVVIPVHRFIHRLVEFLVLVFHIQALKHPLDHSVLMHF